MKGERKKEYFMRTNWQAAALPYLPWLYKRSGHIEIFE
jgi:hypothetical protein